MTPDQSLPFLDAGNPLLKPVTARLDTGMLDIPGSGRVAVLTVRTGSTTLTVMLSAGDLKTWHGVIGDLAGMMDGLARPSPSDTAAFGKTGNGRPQS